MRARRTFGALRWRLFAAFLAVAVGAVGLLALLAVVSVDRRSEVLAEQQQTELREQIGSALAAAYVAGSGTWRPENLAVVEALAANGDTTVVLADDGGREVTRMGPGAHGPSRGTTEPHGTRGEPSNHMTGPAPASGGRDDLDEPTAGGGHDRTWGVVAPIITSTPTTTAPGTATSTEPGTGATTLPIVVDGQQVGTAQLTLPTSEPVAVAAARTALLEQVGLAAVAAVLLAAGAAAVVSRRMSRPLRALADATRAFAAGDPHADARLRPAPGELGEVGAAFTDMAATVRRQDELRRAVVADVAHELRTPITILRGQTEQLLDGITEPTEAHLVSLHDEVLRLGRLTDDLAALSAADAAGLALHPGEVDLGALTERAVDALRTPFADAGLTVELDARADVEVHGDSTRLTQVVTNLLTNAAKFTPPGGTVTVTADHDETDAVLTVADTGPGIAADELPHVFERFWRGRAAGGRSGTGIGLAVVTALVQAHHGTVAATSPAGGGARFTVRLPLMSPTDGAAPGPLEPGS